MDDPLQDTSWKEFKNITYKEKILTGLGWKWERMDTRKLRIRIALLSPQHWDDRIILKALAPIVF